MSRRTIVSALLGLSLVPAACAPLAAAASKPETGIAKNPKPFYGRYRLETGKYSPSLDSGSFTFFPNTVTKGKPPVPSAIVTLHSRTSSDVDYLVDFHWNGSRKTAEVAAGSTDGPTIGRFEGEVTTKRISGSLTIGSRVTRVKFLRSK